MQVALAPLPKQPVLRFSSVSVPVQWPWCLRKNWTPSLALLTTHTPLPLVTWSTPVLQAWHASHLHLGPYLWMGLDPAL